METAVSEDLLEAVRAPVSAEAPAGDDLTYDEAYLHIREEIDKLGTVSSAVDHEAQSGAGGGGVDYAVVAAEAQTLLESRTKDLQLGVYLAFALAQDRGIGGLAEGLAVLQALAETFWDEVHPQKVIRRRNSLQFLSDRGKEWVAAHSFGAGDAETLDAARTALAALQALTLEKMEDKAPALSGLKQALDEAHRKAAAAAAAAEAAKAPPPAAEPEPAADGPGRAATGPASPPPASASAPAAAGTSELRSASDAQREVLRVAAFLREQDAASPVPYRLARALRWGGIVSAPPNEDGKTLIAPPDAMLRTRLEGLRSGGDPRAALLAAEEVFPRMPLWFDLQRVAVEAAESAALVPVAEAILDELKPLLRRCPDLPALAFSDGTPLADPATQLWIATRVATAEGEGSASAGGHVGAGEDPLAESADEVAKRLAKGDLEGALAALRDGASLDRTARDRFRRHLKMAEVCLKGGKPSIAVPFLDQLADEVERHLLGLWDPELAREVWTLLYTGCTALVGGAADAEKPALQERARVAFERVCQIDPAHALSLRPRG